MRIVKDTNIDFMSRTFIASCISALLILVGAVSLITNGGPKLSIDFKGGTLVAVNFTDPVDINKIRSSLSSVTIDGRNFDFSKEEIKHFGDESNIAIRIASIENEPPRFANRVSESLASVYPDLLPSKKSDFILSIDKVGPKVGAELSSDAILAILYALGFILIYICLLYTSPSPRDRG